MRVFLRVLPILSLLVPAPLTAGTTTRFQFGEQGGVLIPVRLNGAGPFMLVLDTGATHTAITTAVAAAIGAPAVATSNVISPTHEARRIIVAIDRLEIGPTSQDIVLASVIPDRSLDAEGKIQGLLGQDVLASLRFTIDFVRREVQWHADAAPQHGVALPLTLANGRFLVDLPQHGDVLRMVPDSGAGGIVLFNPRQHVRPWARATGRTVQVVTANGRLSAMEFLLSRFQIGDRTLRDLKAVGVDRPAFHPAEGDGLLPLHLFDRVSFDGPARLLFLG